MISPILWVVVGYFLGLMLERVILVFLARLARRTHSAGDDIILASLRRFPLFVCTLAGMHFALQSVPLSPTASIYARKVFIALIILAATFVLSRMAVGFLNLALQRLPGGLAPTTIFATTTQIIIFVVGILTILHTFGISIVPLLTALGVGGLAVALALQDTLANLLAGLHILAARKIVPGQYIALDSGQEGTITDITWRNTTLVTAGGNLVIVPNSKIASAIVTNFSLPALDLTVRVDATVSFDSDAALVERTALDVARSVIADFDEAVKNYEPVLRWTGFGESAVNFALFIKSRAFADQFVLRSELYRRLWERFKEAGIVIPYPSRTIYIRGN
ncbi:MAG: mechanosensitive ion channel family protein [bacterium JZ-2024 1]